jgi:hypothetical protein
MAQQLVQAYSAGIHGTSLFTKESERVTKVSRRDFVLVWITGKKPSMQGL